MAADFMFPDLCTLPLEVHQTCMTAQLGVDSNEADLPISYYTSYISLRSIKISRQSFPSKRIKSTIKHEAQKLSVKYFPEHSHISYRTVVSEIDFPST